MKNKNKSNIELRSLSSSGSLGPFPKSPARSLQISLEEDNIGSGGNRGALVRVSEWYDTDGHRAFIKAVTSGDILELRNSGTSHWGIARKNPTQPNGKKSDGDEVMIYHLIHSPAHRGQLGQFTVEEFWKPDCRIRINNTTNGMSLYGTNRTIPRAEVLDNACTAHNSTTLKWQTCSDFIRWSCEDNENQSSASSSRSDVGHEHS